MKIMKYIGALVFFVLLLFSCSKEKRSDKKGLKMQEFVVAISNHARNQNPNFIVIPQNGIELAFNDLAPEDGLNQEFMNAIDGFGIEELFFNTTEITDSEILGMAQKVGATKTIMVADYAESNSNYTAAVLKCQNNGFICYPRKEGNYDYQYIPTDLINENADNITTLADAKNYIYLIRIVNLLLKQTF